MLPTAPLLAPTPSALMGVLSSTPRLLPARSMNRERIFLPNALTLPRKPGCQCHECPGGRTTAWRGCPSAPPQSPHRLYKSSQGGFAFLEPTQGFVGRGPGVSQLLGWQKARGWQPPRVEEAEQPFAWLLLPLMPQHRWPWGRGRGARLSEQARFRLRTRSGQRAAALRDG